MTDGGMPDASPDASPDAATGPCTAGQWFVDGSASSGGDGTSWATAFDSFDALAAAAAVDGGATSGDRVFVKAGTYRASVNQTLVTMIAGVEYYGGFAGTEACLEDRSMAATILDGDANNDDDIGMGTGDAGTAARSDNANHVVVAAPGSVLDGFEITGGVTQGGTAWPNNCGAAYWASNADGAMLRNAVVDGNVGLNGAVCSINAGAITVANAVIRDNIGAATGALYFNNAGGSGTQLITNVTLLRNSSSSWATDFYVANASNVLVTNLTVAQSSGASALAYANGTATVEFVNSVLAGAGNNFSPAQSSTITARNSCSDATLPTGDAGPGNVNTGSSPVVVVGNQVFVAPASGCEDIGDDAAANDATSGFVALGLPDWSTLTTRQDGTLDGTPINAGRHYVP
jgi:hypothetical protein